MNPVDHPLGGGEGKSSGGRHPVSPWGKAEGRTRSRNKKSQFDRPSPVGAAPATHAAIGEGLSRYPA